MDPKVSHDHELHQDMPEAPQPRQGDRQHQEEGARALDLDATYVAPVGSDERVGWFVAWPLRALSGRLCCAICGDPAAAAAACQSCAAQTSGLFFEACSGEERKGSERGGEVFWREAKFCVRPVLCV